MAIARQGCSYHHKLDNLAVMPLNSDLLNGKLERVCKSNFQQDQQPALVERLSKKLF